MALEDRLNGRSVVHNIRSGGGWRSSDVGHSGSGVWLNMRCRLYSWCWLDNIRMQFRLGMGLGWSFHNVARVR